MELSLNIQTRSIRREFTVQSEHCKLKHSLDRTHTHTHLVHDFIGQLGNSLFLACNHRNKQRAGHDSSSSVFVVLHFLISSPGSNSIAIYFRWRSSLTHTYTLVRVLCPCFIPGEESDWSRRESRSDRANIVPLSRRNFAENRWPLRPLTKHRGYLSSTL